MKLPKIIALAGKKRAGKTLVASYLEVRYGYTVLNFADSLKDIACNILDVPRSKLEKMKEHYFDVHLEDEHLQIISDKTGVKIKDILYCLGNKRHFSGPRDLLQRLGTEVIRSNDPNWHIRTLDSKINLIDNDKRYCIADLRFENEKSYCELIGSKLVYIQRDILETTIDTHVSENNLTKYDGFNTVLYNNKDVETLFRNLELSLNKTD